MSETKEQKNEFCLHLINNTNSAEILPWLQNPNGIRTIGEPGTREDSIELITEVFAASAIQVFAVEIDRDDDEENTGKLCIELPDDPILRKRVLD